MRSEPAVLSGSENTSPAWRNVLRSAPTTTAPRGRTLFRSAATAGFTERAFDPDNGKNQNGSHAFAGSAIHAWARPPRRCIRRKFNDGAHVRVSLIAAPARLCRRQAIINKNRTWLTVS